MCIYYSVYDNYSNMIMTHFWILLAACVCQLIYIISDSIRPLMHKVSIHKQQVKTRIL